MPAMTMLLVLIHPPVLLPYLHQLLKQGRPVSFHLTSIQQLLVMPEPVAVLETFFGAVAGGIAVI